MANFFDSSVALKLKPFKESAAAVVRELSDRHVLEDEFLLDPTGFLVTRLHDTAAARIPRRQLNGANRFLFSVMSNEKFLGWIKSYQEQTLENLQADPLAVIDKEKVRVDLAKAMLEFGDPEIISAILPGNLGVRYDPDAVSEAIGGNAMIVEGPVETEIVIIAVVAAVIVAVVVVMVGAKMRSEFAERAILRDIFVDTREMNTIAEALVQVGSELRARGRI